MHKIEIVFYLPPSGFGDVEVVTRSQERPLPEWLVKLQRKGAKQEMQRATVRKYI